jgi:Mat/Ecp fimbriae adhesin
MIKVKTLLGMVVVLAVSNTVYALTQPNTIYATLRNDIVFFENDNNNDYYIGSRNTDPRFTGANAWIKYGRLNQVALGYMGLLGSWSTNWNADLWLEDAIPNKPIQGNRCWNTSANCPSEGYLIPEYTDNHGAYKMRYTGGAEAGGLYRAASFGPGMYEFMRQQSINSVSTFVLNTCQTREDYNPATGGRCTDATSGNWTRRPYEITKLGHVRFTDTKAFSEIWVATDGTPSLVGGNSEFCKELDLTGGNTSTGYINARTGIACKMVEYHTTGNPSSYPPSILFSMVVDNTSIKYTPAAAYIKLNGGIGAEQFSNWRDYTATGRLDTFMQEGAGFVTVLFTKNFFIQMLRAGGSVSGQEGTFTFSITNSSTGQSGYYQFATGIDVNIIPREYGISIRHKNQDERVKTGKIGEEEQDITFDYVITQSAPRKADTVKASVVGESTTKAGKSYCLFKSSDNSLQVPIPAYLSFTQADGRDSGLKYSGCNASATVELKDAQWSETPWDEQQSGYFYSTDLKLRFPMNDPVSLFTTDGIDWLGSVRAEGDVKVEATWIGVNK